MALIKLVTTALLTLSTTTSAKKNPWEGNATVMNELYRIADWTMSTGVGTNALNNSHFASKTSIFINGDSARVLLAVAKVADAGGDARAAGWRAEALRWCDSLVALQIPITTSTGATAGFWNTGYDEIFIADTGTAVTTLTLCAAVQKDGKKKARYVAAMNAFATFVTEGCAAPPLDVCTSPPYPGCNNSAWQSMFAPAVCPKKGGNTEGWVITSGKDKGGVGDGWYEGKINDEVYTISTATSGSCAFVETAALRGQSDGKLKKKLETIAKGAVRWLLASRTPDGRIPYVITPARPHDSVVFQPITYSTESMIICDLRYPELHAELATLKSTVRWLASHQNKDGSWGNWSSDSGSGSSSSSAAQHAEFSPSGDAQRSPRALSLLQWYTSHVEPDAAATRAIGRWLDFALDRQKSAQFGVAQSDGVMAKESPLVTGFVGLALADLVMPWSTFNPL